jgi:adenylate cyclase
MVLNAGASAVLVKPFTNDSLLAIVERSLGDRRSRKEKEQLGRYVSKASMRMAVEKAILGSDDNNARADKKLASVFFSDIAGFTDRCERYSAKEIVEQINLLFKVMTEVIIRNEGDIDKFIGDACMAFWLDEIEASSSEKILKSILEMQHQIDLMNSEHPLLSKDPIVVRMGANGGEVILCDIGAADARMDLTIIGDTVNVAARLESASKQYGLTNLVSENVVQGNEQKFLFRMIDKVRVKGKKEPLNCYELMCLKGLEKNNHLILKKEFELALSYYNTANFEKALLGFNKSTAFEEGKELGVTPSSIYISRCEYLLKNPPDNWDGIWTLTEK